MEKRPIGLDQILLFGDSITQYSFDPFANGFGAFLSHAYVRKCDVVNRGFSGYNTKWAKPLLPAILDTTLPCPSESNQPRTLLATVFLGANDACIPETHRQYVSMEEYAQNLKWMIDLLKSKDIQVLLITPPPVDPARWEAHCLEKGRALDRTVENTKKYRNACIHVAAENNVPYLDTWELFLGPNLEWSSDKLKHILNDGLHFDCLGNKLVGDALLAKIVKEWPELDPAAIKNPVAWHDVLDPNHLPDSIFMR